jgi:hypothetical protein
MVTEIAGLPSLKGLGPKELPKPPRCRAGLKKLRFVFGGASCQVPIANCQLLPLRRLLQEIRKRLRGFAIVAADL